MELVDTIAELERWGLCVSTVNILEKTTGILTLEQLSVSVPAKLATVRQIGTVRWAEVAVCLARALTSCNMGLRGASARIGASVRESPMWRVYLVRCKDKSLYCGIALDVQERVVKHNAGKGGAYTSSRKPVRLIAVSRLFDRSTALRVEAAIKKLKVKDKIEALKRYWGDVGQQ
jgi:putative endonuclease